MALDHPERVRTLTLVGTRPTSPGKADADLPDHAPELMAALFSGPEPDWTDRASVVETMLSGARVFAGSGGFDEAAGAHPLRDGVRPHGGRTSRRSRSREPPSARTSRAPSSPP